MEKRIKLCSQIDLVQYIGAQIPLKAQGSLFVGGCPFCREQTFVICPEKRSFYCFACRTGGDLVDYVQRRKDLSETQAMEVLAASLQGEAPAPLPDSAVLEQAAAFYQQQLRSNPTAQTAIDQLHRWSLRGEKILSLGIGYHDAHFQPLIRRMTELGVDHATLKRLGCIRTTNEKDFDAMRDSIILPLTDPAGQILAFDAYWIKHSRWTRSPDTEHFTRSLYLFGLRPALQSGKKTVLVVSRYEDYFGLIGRGITNVVCTDTEGLCAAQAELLHRHFRMILLWVPRSGYRNAYWQACKQCHMPCQELPLADCRTPTDFLEKYGSEFIEVKMSVLEKRWGNPPQSIYDRNL